MAKGIKSNEPDARVVYADIIRLPHWQSPTRTPMSAYERAAQFSSFNALAGYEDMVGEEAREVGSFQELTESEMEVLNQKISLIADALENDHHPVLKFTYPSGAATITWTQSFSSSVLLPSILTL